MTYLPCEMLSQKRVGPAWTSAPQDRQVTHVRRFRRLSLRRFATRPSKSNTDGDGLECLKARSGYGRGQRHSEGDTGARRRTGQGVGCAALRRARPRAERQPVPARAGRGAGARGSPECPWPGRSRPGLRTSAERGGKPRPGSRARGCHGKLCSRRPEGRPRRRRGGCREQRLDGGRTVVAAAEEVVRFWKVCHRYLERSQEPGGPLPAGDGWGGRGGLLPSPDWPQGRSVVSVWPGRRTQAFWQTLF